MMNESQQSEGIWINKDELDGDPRRDGDAIHEFVSDEMALDQLPPDYMSLLSLMLGLMSYMLMIPLLAWFGVFCLISSIVNMKTTLVDYKQIFCAVLSVGVGLVSNYSSIVFC